MVYITNENYDFIEKKDSIFEKLVTIKRSAKVTKGGRVFGFSAITVIGDKNGKFGIGKGKSKEIPSAIQKSIENAKNNLVFIKLNNGTIFSEIFVKYCSTKLIMLPAKDGTGIIAPFVIRTIFEAIGIKNIFTKCFGSRNQNNVINCAIKGLFEISKLVESSSIRSIK